MIFVLYITVLVIYVYHANVFLTIEFDGFIDFDQSWKHKYPILQDSEIYPDSIREEYTPVIPDDTLKKKFNIPSSKKSSLNKQTKETKEYLIEHKNETFKKRNNQRRKKKSKKAPSMESLDHDKINLDEFSLKKAKIKKGVTKIIDVKKSEKIKARKVKEVKKINDFIQHIYKQTLKVFNNIKRKTTDNKLKHEISTLKRVFKDKFGKYVSETNNHTLKTHLGKQKIILNTIDTSHKLLQRLINNFHKDMDKESLRTNIGAVKSFQKEVDREKDLENKHACKNLKVCRLNDEFSDFVSEIITIIVLSDDRKIKQAADALTEAVKNTDFDNVLNYDLQNKLKMYISNVEKWDAFMTRAMFLAIKMVLANKNKPIAIFNSQDNYLVNKTIAFQDIINLADEKLPKSENAKEWEKIKQDIIDWKEDRNKEPLKIAENFVNHFKEKALDTLDFEGKKRFSKSMTVLLSHI